MATVTRFDEALDDLLRGFFVRPVGFQGTQAPAAAPAQFRVDVSENEQAYVIRAEIPGVRKEDINISIDGDQVAISAEVKNEKEVKDGERLLRNERYYGKVYRAFALGQPVDDSGASAKYNDGILELTLPKKAAAQSKRIAIE
ncbi:MAG TPA: Hsp20/alpha crystallin family protein [Burkholderiales bacterium]|jgi:HSP20 family protein|nr:Hsp20/alpha crystallin family protein [Burkholderiales bacterium]